MPKNGTADTTAVISAGSDHVFQSAFQTALKQATSSLKGMAELLAALVALVAGYYAFQEKLKLPGQWPVAICGAFLVLFLLVFFVPALRDQIKLQRLKVEGIHGVVVHPAFFQLTAYDLDDASRFDRSDGAANAVCRWIEASSSPVLYLSGQSGAGKSSLINAAIVPQMSAKSWVVVPLRPHDAPLEQITAALLQPSVIWRKPPDVQMGVRDLIEQAAEKIRKDGKRILLIIDQFEEALILCGDEAKQALNLWLRGLVERPIPGLKVMLTVRAEYLNDLPEHGLPFPAFGTADNAFEVRPFTRAAAQAFMAKSGLDMAPQLLARILDEASEIEDMPDRVRPIILNMFGLIVGSFSGSLPSGVKVGRLLSGYVERSLKGSNKHGFGARILRPLITDAGTKRTLTIEEIADEAGVERVVARGCLIPLANDGLVRRLPGTAEKWEIAHDFVARLLQPILRSWRQGIWEGSKRYLASAAVILWLVIATGLIVIYPSLHDEYVISELQTIGVVPRPSIKDGLAFNQNGTQVTDNRDFWRILALLPELSEKTGSLDLHDTGITSLQGMPALPSLTELDLSFSKITSLQGMPALPTLTKLYLAYISITSLQGMPALPALTELSFSNTGITSLQGMPALPALAKLRLSGSGITSLQGMPALPTLTDLDLSYSLHMMSLQGMPALPALTKLNLSYSKIMSLQGMPALPALTGLDLYDSDITSLQGMPAFPALTELDLSFSKITSLQGMPAFPALTKLRLSYSKIMSLQGMPALPALTELDLSDCPITSVQGMPALPTLTELSLHGTIITSLQELPALSALTSLDLSNTGITSLQGMPTLPKVTWLRISNNKITSLQGMPALPALKWLYLDGTRLKSLQGLPALPALTELDLSKTAITTLQGMPALPNLQTIIISPNQSEPSGLPKGVTLERSD